MTRNVTIELPDEMESTMVEAMREDGVAADVLISVALKDYLTARKFRHLRAAMMAEARQPYTDEEIFESVS